ncbi:MAG: hypothetical protein KDB74_08885 [Flavobacteriales bacterium]|nr:hypothetical protein [Flavobacteriales bacterium]
MKYFYSVIALIILITSTTHSQIVVVDQNNNPIPYVDIIISNKKTFFWQTDLSGNIPQNTINKMTRNDSIVLRHISYKTKVIIRDSIIKDTIMLLPNIYNLKEIEINSKMPKYQKINACFRNSVRQDGQLVYYSDGETDYFTKNKKIEYSLFRKSYRSFENKNISEFLNNYKTSIPINKAYTPTPEDIYLPYNFIKKHKLIQFFTDAFNSKILTPDSNIVGEMRIGSNTITYELNNIFELKTQKALNTEVTTTDFYIYMVFRKDDEQDVTELNKSYNKLLYLKIIYGQTFKHDKEKKKRKIETIEEIFVENISFTNLKDQDYSKHSGMPRSSSYDEEFWNDCDCELYYTLDNNTLTEMRQL